MNAVELPVAKSDSGSAFGRRLRALRDAAGMTQQELADAAGIHIITVSKLERGKIDPSWTVVLAVATALGVRPNDFEEDEPTTATDEQSQAAELLPESPTRPMGKRK